jgi:hypothetical protein
MRKILLAVLAAVLVIGAVPLTAQIAGPWEGTGTGICQPPFPSPSKAMGPWREWSGEIPDDEATLSGQWHDAWGFQGSFYAESTIGTPTEAVFTGTWNVFAPDGTVYEMGTFYMHFPYAGRACHGEWWIYAEDNPKGTMTGWRVN